MKRSYLVIACILILAVTENCTVSKNQSKVNNTFEDNQLTEAEKNSGWKLLFDGTSLNGWRTYKNETGSSWNAVHGMICSQRNGSATNPDLVTTDMYSNFELSIDWKLSAQGNSGIMYLVTEQYEHPYQTGPEYQLVDDDGYPDKLEDWQKTGASYAMYSTQNKKVNPPGTWNNTVIKVNNGHVEHWLNGQLLFGYEMGSEKWKELKTQGKWKDEPDYGVAKTGHIALQAAHSNVENSGVCFKNIKLRTL